MDEDEERIPTHLIGTCHTVDCPLEGQASDVWAFANPVEPVFRVQCAPCGQMMTDLVVVEE